MNAVNGSGNDVTGDVAGGRPAPMVSGGPYRASLIKRRPRPAPPAPAPAPVPTRDLEMEERRARRARIAAEREAVARIEAMTSAWNAELSSTVPSLAAIVSRAVAAIVGEAPRDEVVLSALRREVGRVRGDHRPVLRVSATDRRDWVERLAERGEAEETPFTVRRDDGLAQGKCILELGARRVDLSPETQVAAFEDHMRGGVSEIDAPPAPTLPAMAAASRESESDPLEPIAPEPDGETARSLRIDRGLATRARTVRSAATASSGEETERSAHVKAGAARATTSRSRPLAPAADAPSAASDMTSGGADNAITSLRTSRGEPVSPPSMDAPAIDPTDFDALDLGADAARFETVPEPVGKRSGIAKIVEDELTPESEPSGVSSAISRVSALRQRVSRDVSSLRAMVDDADREPEADDASRADGRAADHEASSSRWASVIGGSRAALPRPEAVDAQRPGDAARGDGIRAALTLDERAHGGMQSSDLADRAEPSSNADVGVNDVPAPNDGPAPIATAPITTASETARERRRRSLNLPPWMEKLARDAT